MLEKIKKRLKSRTYQVAIVGGVLTMIEVNSGLILGWVPVEAQPYVIALWPLAMMSMREITNAALEDK